VHNHDHNDAHRLLATLGVTGTIMVAEIAGGIYSGSLALLADAGHMLADFLAILVAYGAVALGQRPADERRTYGYRRLEILAALVNGVGLVVISGSIAFEAVDRWLDPREVQPVVMGAVAAVGLAANGVGLFLLGGHRENLNMRGAFLHILGDTLSSVGVLVAAVGIAATGFVQLDALVSLGIAFVIVITSVALLREVFDVLLEAAPHGLDAERVRAVILAVPGVCDVHDLHVWSITSGLPALSAHVVVGQSGVDPYAVGIAVKERLGVELDVHHTTLQVEQKSRADCGCGM
jgi:cobalt-zinc-cadmium efflux system protein